MQKRVVISQIYFFGGNRALTVDVSGGWYIIRLCLVGRPEVSSRPRLPCVSGGWYNNGFCPALATLGRGRPRTRARGLGGECVR